MDFIHIKDSEVGHPWNVMKVVEDVTVYRFHKETKAISSNSGRAIKWVHAIEENEFLSMSNKDIEEFKKLFGSYISAIHIKYGEIVGTSGWDVTFRPEDVVNIEVW